MCVTRPPLLVSPLHSLSYMFYSADFFNADISKWAVSKVTTM